jgi:hypothetical protein
MTHAFPVCRLDKLTWRYLTSAQRFSCICRFPLGFLSQLGVPQPARADGSSALQGGLRLSFAFGDLQRLTSTHAARSCVSVSRSSRMARSSLASSLILSSLALSNLVLTNLVVTSRVLKGSRFVPSEHGWCSGALTTRDFAEKAWEGRHPKVCSDCWYRK